MSDSSAVDVAVMAKLSGDATLMGVTTDGVWRDEAPQGATKFVIVSQQAHEDNYQENGEAYELFTYLVKAVTQSTSGSDVSTAAARIHTLLQDGALSPTGFRLLNMHRTERIVYTEVDESNLDLRWQHRGGLYEVMVEAT